jgi:tripartite-type tricarboxylate transporter receptor subunit TctC
MYKQLSVLVIIFVLITVLAACAPAPTPAPTQAPPTAAPQPTTASTAAPTAAPVVATAAPQPTAAGAAVAPTSATTAKAFKEGDQIKIIIPFAAGGGYDKVARLMQPYFQQYIKEVGGVGVTVIVENVEGAGGVLGYSQMARGTPDGKTLGVIGLSGAPYQQLATGEFDMQKMVPIGQINTDPTMMVVSSKSPIQNFKDLFSRSQTKSVLLGTSGQGASEHIEGLVFQAMLKEVGQDFKVDFVHYTGSGPALVGIVKGEAEGIMCTESSCATMVKSGDLRPLGIFSAKHGNLLPDVPTVAELGVPNAAQLSNVLGMIRILMASPGTPDATAQVLRDALQKALANPDFLQKAATANITIAYGTADSVKSTVAARLAVANKYKDLVMPVYK